MKKSGTPFYNLDELFSNLVIELRKKCYDQDQPNEIKKFVNKNTLDRAKDFSKIVDYTTKLLGNLSIEIESLKIEIESLKMMKIQSKDTEEVQMAKNTDMKMMKALNKHKNYVETNLEIREDHIHNLEQELQQEKDDKKIIQKRYDDLFRASCLLCCGVILTILYRILYKDTDKKQANSSESYYTNASTEKASSKKGNVNIGDRVKVRRTEQQKWAFGEVKQLNPTKVIVDGWQKAYEWNQINPITTTENTETHTHMRNKVTESCFLPSSDDCCPLSFTQSDLVSSTNSHKINTKSYEKILRRHFRKTSSSNIHINPTTIKTSRPRK